MWCEQRHGFDSAKFFDAADVALLNDEAIGAGFVTGIGESFRQRVGGFAQSERCPTPRHCSTRRTGELRPQVGAVYPLADAQNAFMAKGTEHIPGKVVLAP